MTLVSPEVPRLECDKEVQRMIHAMHQTVTVKFRRRGGVIALSGGVNSAVTAILAVRALGAERVFASSCLIANHLTEACPWPGVLRRRRVLPTTWRTSPQSSRRRAASDTVMKRHESWSRSTGRGGHARSHFPGNQELPSTSSRSSFARLKVLRPVCG